MEYGIDFVYANIINGEMIDAAVASIKVKTYNSTVTVQIGGKTTLYNESNGAFRQILKLVDKACKSYTEQ